MAGTATPGAGTTAKDETAAVRASGSWWQAWAIATGVITLSEWLLLVVQFRTSFIGVQQMVLLLALTFGNWLPYAGGVLLGFRAAAWASQALQRWRSLGQARWLVAGVGALLASPYAVWLARFTFSGARARVMAHHTLLVVAVSVAVSLALGFAVWLSGVRFRLRALRLGWASLLSAAVFGTLWLSRAVMPSEYEPLHGFLALLALIAAGLAGSALARETRAVTWQSDLTGSVVLALCACLSAYRLGQSEDESWILWSQTGGSRYLTQRWTFLADAEQGGRDASLVAKPDLETPQTLAWRKQRAEAPAPNIVIFSIDGLVPTHVGAYGYTARPTTPNIDRLARRGVRFTRAFSTYPATKQFNSSLLLGRLVPASGATRAPASFRERAITRLLHDRGYHSFVQSWFESSTRNKFDPKYFRIDTNIRKSSKKDVLELPMAERMVAIERHFREASEAKKPIFAWMHLLSTHPVKHDFVPHPSFAWGESRSERYDSAIAGTDLWLPELEKLMAKYGDAERGTIWIICSDHGVRVEGAGRDLYANIVRVPLIVVGPGFEPRTLDVPIEVSVDLAATVLDLAGLTPPESYDGISLVPLLLRGDVGSRMAGRVVPLLRGDSWRGAVHGPYKLLRYNDSFSFYDAVSDPSEEHNIYSEKKPLARKIWRAADAEIKRRLAAFAESKEEVAAEEEDDD